METNSTIRRIANLLAYGFTIEQVRAEVTEGTDTEFFYAFKAAVVYGKE